MPSHRYDFDAGRSALTCWLSSRGTHLRLLFAITHVAYIPLPGPGLHLCGMRRLVPFCQEPGVKCSGGTVGSRTPFQQMLFKPSLLSKPLQSLVDL